MRIRDDNDANVNRIQAIRQSGEETAPATVTTHWCITCSKALLEGQPVRYSPDGTTGRHLEPKDCFA